MQEQRHHLGMLLAALIFIGAATAIGSSAHELFEHNSIGDVIAWVVSAFVAAHLARRLVALSLARLAFVAALTTALMTALSDYVRYGFELETLGWTAVSLVAAFAGGACARTQRTTPVWLGAGAACAALGAMTLCAGVVAVADLADELFALALLAAVAGAALVAHVLGATSKQAAVGSCVIGATITAITADASDRAAATVVGGIVGFLLGAAGGAIGAKLRARAATKLKLPELARAKAIE